ncbi:MAG: GNAT family N-acetyltransferase [Acetobacteraceae bacterium]|nr:GNAT family N-acetyltransferase [Acetobacteraceae bacterium]
MALLLGKGEVGIGGRPRTVVASGVNAAFAASLGALDTHLRCTATRPSPRADLSRDGGSFLQSVSANTRYQIRRSNRTYAASGCLALTRAGSPSEAREFLDGLIALHEATWTRRRGRGAFANPSFDAFHRALVERGLARNEIDLLRIAAGKQVIGYLYNFRYRDRVYAYQSGFDYDGIASQHKPGLTSHALAIEHYRTLGITSYDFLAGGDRYKLSLANAQETLAWLQAAPRRSLRGRVRMLDDNLRALARSIRNHARATAG